MLQNPTKPNLIYLIYMYKGDLALNNLKWLICHKTQLNQTKCLQIIHIREEYLINSIVSIRITRNHFTVCKQMSFDNPFTNYLLTNHIYVI